MRPLAALAPVILGACLHQNPQLSHQEPVRQEVSNPYVPQAPLSPDMAALLDADVIAGVARTSQSALDACTARFDDLSLHAMVKCYDASNEPADGIGPRINLKDESYDGNALYALEHKLEEVARTGEPLDSSTANEVAAFYNIGADNLTTKARKALDTACKESFEESSVRAVDLPMENVRTEVDGRPQVEYAQGSQAALAECEKDGTHYDTNNAVCVPSELYGCYLYYDANGFETLKARGSDNWYKGKGVHMSIHELTGIPHQAIQVTSVRKVMSNTEVIEVPLPRQSSQD